MKKYKDGWHTVAGRRVYVENGKILRGMRKDHNGHDVAAWPYRWDKPLRCWIICDGVSVDAFRSLCKRGRGMLS